jgi:hypothetical protein
VTNFEFRRKKGKQNSFRFETGFEVNNLFLWLGKKQLIAHLRLNKGNDCTAVSYNCKGRKAKNLQVPHKLRRKGVGGPHIANKPSFRIVFLQSAGVVGEWERRNQEVQRLLLPASRAASRQLRQLPRAQLSFRRRSTTSDPTTLRNYYLLESRGEIFFLSRKSNFWFHSILDSHTSTHEKVTFKKL